jgi:hypothetical protein
MSDDRPKYAEEQLKEFAIGPDQPRRFLRATYGGHVLTLRGAWGAKPIFDASF